jgi:dephospho-CoA kinase
MKVVGLTGGIGSGKTTVAKMFEDLGVPVYIADIEAKNLSNRSKIIKRKIIELLGEKAYRENELNRLFVANKIFNDANLLEAVNKIIHPKVAAHFKKWLAKQNSTYCIKEAAILFENGGYKKCDLTILVTAPIEVRIDRVIKRDKTSRESILERISNQWSDEEKKKLADIIIENIDLSTTKKEVIRIHNSLS